MTYKIFKQFLNKKSLSTFFVLALSSTFLVAQQVAPTNFIPFGARSSYSKFIGNLKVDSSFLLPSRPPADTLNGIFKNGGSIFFNTDTRNLMYYDGTKFTTLATSASATGKYWSWGGDDLPNASNASIGTRNDISLSLLQNSLARLVITPAGYVGINNINPQYQLDVNGVVQAKGARFGRMLSGNAPATSSDVRFKKDIQTLTNALEKISNLRGVSYFLKVDDFPSRAFVSSKQFGFIAQEVEKVIPELVNTESDGYKSVTYTSFIPYLVEAIKQQNQQIKELEEKNKEQDEKIQEILQMLKKMEQKK